jgi:hypothetical protein
VAYVSTPGLWIPGGVDMYKFAQGGTSYALDASGEKLGCLVPIPKTGTLDKIMFSVNAVTTGDDIKVSFQDVDTTTGNPVEVVDEYRVITVSTPGAKLTGSITSDGTDGGVKRSVTAGDYMFVVFEFNSFVAGNLTLSHVTAMNSTATLRGYTTHKTGGTWTKASAAIPRLTLVYDDGSTAYAPTLAGHSGINNASFSSVTSPDEYGNIFQIPFACKLGGAYWRIDLDGPADAVLYDSDGTTELGSAALNSNVRAFATVGMAYVKYPDVALLANTSYRLALRPSSATTIGYEYWDVSAAAHWDQWWGGQTWHQTSRVNLGAWTQLTTRRLMMAIQISEVAVNQNSRGLFRGLA